MPHGVISGNWTADDTLDNWFTHHPPQGDDARRYQEIRAAGRDLARLILGNCPVSPERDEALTKIREAVMWGNASIACHQPGTGGGGGGEHAGPASPAA